MAVSKVKYGGNTLIDLTNDTVDPDTLAYGVTAHDASGAIITGTATPVSLVQGTGDRTDAVMSQKATTDAIKKAISDIMPEFVDSVDQMTDTSKKYVLISTGTVWQYDGTMVETEVSTEITDPIVGTTNNPYQTGRLSSGGALSADVSTHTLTPYIDLTKAEYQGKTIQIHLEGNRYASEALETYIMSALYDANKNVILGRGYTTQVSGNTFDPSCIEINDTASAIITLSIPYTFSGKTVGFVRFCGLGTVKDSVYITYTKTETVTSMRGWYDTEVPFSGGGSGSPDIDITEIAEQAAALVDANLLSMVGSGVVSV